MKTSDKQKEEWRRVIKQKEEWKLVRRIVKNGNK